MRCVLTSVILLALGRMALAADVSLFPISGNDLASAADWGGSLPGVSNVVLVGKTWPEPNSSEEHVVTATKDVEFGGLRFRGSGSKTVLDMREALSGSPSRKIRLNGRLNTDGQDGKTMAIRGGHWDLTGQDLSLQIDYLPSRNAKLTISDGAVIDNVGTISGCYSSSSRLIHITGSNTVVTAKVFSVGSYQGSGNELRISDGARLALTGTGCDDKIDYGNGSTDNRLVVTSGASVAMLASARSVQIGTGGSNNGIFVFDNSTVDIRASQVYLASKNAISASSVTNTIALASGTNAVLTLGNALYMGKPTADVTDNFVVAKDGGVVRVPIVYLSGGGNGFVVSNGTIATSLNGIVCDSGFSSGSVRFQGRRPQFVMETSSTPANFVLSDGFRLVYDLPPEGYPDGWTPFRSTRWGTVSDGVEIEINGIGDLQMAMRSRQCYGASYKLMDLYATLPTQMVSRCNETLPDGASLRLSGNAVWLDVTAPLAQVEATTSNPDVGAFAVGAEAFLTGTVRGEVPNFERDVAFAVFDHYDRLVTNVLARLMTDANGEGEFRVPLPTDRLGLFLVRLASPGYAALPKVGTRPAGFVTYCVTFDPQSRPEIPEDMAFMGLHGGVLDESRWIGAHQGFATMFSTQKALDEWRAQQTAFPWKVWGVRNVSPSRILDVWSVLSPPNKAWILAHQNPGFGVFDDPQGMSAYDEFISIVTDNYIHRPANEGRRVYELLWEPTLSTSDMADILAKARIVKGMVRKYDADGWVAAPTFHQINMTRSYQAIFATGLLDEIDMLSTHPYCAEARSGIPPEKDGLIEGVRSLKRLLREYGRTDLPICATESGYDLTSTTDNELKRMNAYVRHALILLGEGFKFHMPFNGTDFGDDGADKTDGDWGLTYNLDYTPKNRYGSKHISPKPALPALAAMSMFVDGSRPYACYDCLGATVWGYAYTNLAGRVTLALWDYETVSDLATYANASSRTEVRLPVGKNRIWIADVMGNRTEADAPDGVLTLELGPSPVYVFDPELSALDPFVAEKRVRGGYVHRDGGREFPDLDGSHVLNSSSAWGTPNVSLADSRVHLVRNGTYAVTEDMTIGGLFVCPHDISWTADDRVVLDLTERNPTVFLAGHNATVSNESGLATHGGIDIFQNRNAEFRGGVWDFGGNQRYNCGHYICGGYNGKHDINLLLTDGCVWTNVASSRLTYASMGEVHWRLENASSMQFAKSFAMTEYASDAGLSLEVLSGSRFAVNEGFYADRGQTGDVTIRVAGAGTRFQCGSDSTFGHLSRRLLVSVEDGASFQQTGWGYFGRDENARGYVLRISGEGTAARMNDFFVNGVSNTIEVLGGASAEVTTRMNVSGNGNQLVVSNAAFKVNVGTLNWTMAGGRVRLLGDCPSVSFSAATFAPTAATAFVFDVSSGGYRENAVPLTFEGEADLPLRRNAKKKKA